MVRFRTKLLKSSPAKRVVHAHMASHAEIGHTLFLTRVGVQGKWHSGCPPFADRCIDGKYLMISPVPKLVDLRRSYW